MYAQFLGGEDRGSRKGNHPLFIPEELKDRGDRQATGRGVAKSWTQLEAT